MSISDIRESPLKDINLFIQKTTGKKGKFTKETREEGIRQVCEIANIEYVNPKRQEINEKVYEKSFEKIPEDQTPTTGQHFDDSTVISNISDLTHTINSNDKTVPNILITPENKPEIRQRPEWTPSGDTPATVLPRLLYRQSPHDENVPAREHITRYKGSSPVFDDPLNESLESMASYHTPYATPDRNVERTRGNKEPYNLSGFTPSFIDATEFTSPPFQTNMSPIENTTTDLSQLIRETEKIRNQNQWS